MGTYLVSRSFGRNQFTDGELIVFAGKVGTNLTTLQVFEPIKQTGTDILTARENFSSYLSNTTSTSKLITTQRRLLRTTLEDALKKGAFQVMEQFSNNEETVLSSGYIPYNKNAPVGILDQATNVKAVLGQVSGSLDVTWDVVEGAVMYEVHYSAVDDNTESEAQILTCTKSRISLEGLIPGKRYKITVAGLGTDPRKVWSDEYITPYVS